MTLEFSVSEQTLKPLPTASVPRSGSRDYLKLKFIMDATWDSYTTKTVYFKANGYVDFQNIKANEEVKVGEYFTAQDHFQIMLTAMHNTQEVPTNNLTITLDTSGDLWRVSPPEVGSTGIQQLLQATEDAKRTAQEALQGVAKLKDGSESISVQSADIADTLNIGGIAYAAVQEITVGGDDWHQVEPARTLDEPYLKEWGWLCCTDAEKEIYRWLYRCMAEGLEVSTRTVKAGQQTYACSTDGKKVATDVITGDIVARLGTKGEKIVSQVMKDAYVTFLRIPVVQFGIADERILYKLVQRVINDNPLLIFPFWPSMPDSVSAIMENGVCKYLYSVFPTQDKLCQAREVCEEQISAIVKTVEEVYELRPDAYLSMSQKAKVLKVIHDCIVLHGNFEGKEIAWWQPTPYAVFDCRYEGLCTSYTMAFCAVARRFGIEAINMTGVAYVDTDAGATGYETVGEHSWVAVRLSDDEYGTYPSDPALWSCIDVYWDEPKHMADMGLVPDRDDVSWRYFLNMEEINILSESETETGHSYRAVDARIAYGELPMDGMPSLSIPYGGNEIYTWEDDVI